MTAESIVVVVALPAGTSTLRIEADVRGWSRLSLASSEGEVALGADALAVVVPRLLGFLLDPPLRGAGSCWVTSLAEKHTSIYAAPAASGRRLQVMDEHGKPLAALDLDEGAVDRWLHALATLAQRLPLSVVGVAWVQ